MGDWQEELSALEALDYLFTQQVECDVKFHVRGDVIGAHRSVVEARSSVLMKMLADSGDSIHIESTDSETFRTVLKYLYTDQIEVTEDNIFLLLHAAADFKMKHLEKRCVAFIGSFLHPHNLCELANKAEGYDALQYCDTFHEVFSNNTQEVLDSVQFVELSQTVLTSLLETEQLTVVEVELFQALLRWAQHQCNQTNLLTDGANMRAVLGSVLYKIRFPTMSIRDFANTVTTIPGLLTDTEISQVFRKMTVYNSSEVECPFSEQYRCRVKLSSSLSVGTAANLLSHTNCRHTNGQNQTLGNVLLWWNGSGHDIVKPCVVHLLDACGALLNTDTSNAILEASTNPTVKREILQHYNDFASLLQQHPANFKNQQYLDDAMKLARLLVKSLGSLNP